MRKLIATIRNLFRREKINRDLDAEIHSYSTMLEDEKLSTEETEKDVWSQMNRAFSAPVERGDESLDYTPTQILAETFKSVGYDGVGYKSSYGESGFNVALFDLASADLVTCGLHRVKDVSIKTTQEEAPYFVKETDS